MKYTKIFSWFVYVFGTILVLFFLFINFFPVKKFFSNVVFHSTRIYDRNGILLYETLHPDQGKTTEIGFDQLPEYLIQATIATEDQDFYSNSGVDLGGITRAIFSNIRAGEVVSGASTITQQLVRNVIGTNKKRTVLQKITESLLALRVAKVFTKDQILQMYFNKIYYGNLNYGVAAASHGYFGKEVSGLDLAESAFLAGLPQAPNRYNPFEHHEDALKRKNYVLSLMQKIGFISPDEAKEAQAETLKFEQNLITIRAPHFVSYVIDDLENRFGKSFISGGLEVTTSLDYSMQQKVQSIARQKIAELVGRNVTNASVIVLDPKTGDILAMLGSLDYFNESIDGQVNIALRARQPGSSMKPVTYASAFEKRWYGGTMVKDEPVRFFTADGTPYLPKNYDYRYHGLVSVRTALSNSYNIPAVKAIHSTTVDAVLQKARDMGLSTLSESADYYGLALTLGDAEVRLLDLTNAYMIFDNGGIKKSPQDILQIKNSKGNVLYTEERQSGQRVLGEDISFMITDILSDNAARVVEFGLYNILEIDRPAAVKTGTTRNFRDNWTIGYTPDFVVGVWVGNSDNSEMHNISGVYGAGPIWHDVMMEIHRGKEKKEFFPPASVEKKDGEWIPRNHPVVVTFADDDVAGTEASLSNTDALKKASLIIKKPFDLDIFQLDPNVDTDVQQIRFEVEKESSVGAVQWIVNKKQIGSGDSIFWQLTKGEFDILAQASDKSGEIMKSDPIHIVVQ